MSITINPEDVTQIMLENTGQFHPAPHMKLVEVDGPFAGPKPRKMFEVKASPENGYYYVPLESIRAVQTRNRIVSAEERQAIEAEKRASEVALFKRQHRTDEATFNAVMAAQGGKCSVCGSLLRGMAIVHYDEMSKTLRCARCSEFKPRFGID